LFLPAQIKLSSLASFSPCRLLGNKGYECAGGDCNNLVLGSPAAGSLPGSQLELVGEVTTLTEEQIVAGLKDGSHIYVAHVRNRSHFVLLTGVSETQASNGKKHVRFVANDPFFKTDSYLFTEIADIITYKVIKPVVPKAFPWYSQCDGRWGQKTMVRGECALLQLHVQEYEHAVAATTRTCGSKCEPLFRQGWVSTKYRLFKLCRNSKPSLSSTRIADTSSPKNICFGG
jgi:hypothetical protein